MQKTFDFLKNRTQVNYPATINGDRPSCRPFGDWAEADGYTLDNPDFQIFYLTNANSTIYDINGEILATEDF